VKKILAVVFLNAFWSAGFSENLPLNEMGKPFSSPNLVVHWKVQTNVFPSTVWIYRLRPTIFSPAVISNLMQVARLTSNDETKNDASENFVSSDKTRSLQIDSTLGRIDYTDESVVHSGATNLSVDVPQENELLGLTTNLLPELGLKPSDIKKKKNSNEPEFNFYEPELTMYYFNSVLVSNIPQRSVFFRRALDSGAFLGNDEGGNCWIYFGSHKAISKIALKWPTIERYKSFPVADFKTLAKWIREGKARHGFISMNVGEIDWAKLKSMTVSKAEMCYLTGKNYVYPIASLWTTIDTGYGEIDIEIDCPIIDETKQ
jgi:hypothetical protein